MLRMSEKWGVPSLERNKVNRTAVCRLWLSKFFTMAAFCYLGFDPTRRFADLVNVNPALEQTYCAD